MLIRIIFVLSFFAFQPVVAETIMIKRSGGRKSKAILDKKFVFMKKSAPSAFIPSSSSSPSSASSKPRVQNVRTLNSLSQDLQKVPKPKKVVKRSGKSSNGGRASGMESQMASRSKSTQQVISVEPDENAYDESNWGDYMEYEEVEIEESLGVNAKLIH